MGNVLVIYYHRYTYPMRKTIEDHIFCFKKYSSFNYYFVNEAFGIPFYLRYISFDLILYQTTFMACLKWINHPYETRIKNYEELKKISGVKAILPQDEFVCSKQLCSFIKDFNIDKIFSVSPESEWKKIYEGIDFEKHAIYSVLTGYLNEEIVDNLKNLFKSIPKRDIDICYRAWKAESWLGKHGLLKTEIAEIFKAKAPDYNLSIDISTDDNKTFFGMDWYRFLLRSKYTIGVEGGSSILDGDGSIRKKVSEYTKKFPQASFEEIQQACFPGMDGGLQLFALSPRHLEACLTKTCQILIEGEYGGILKPGLHYIELKRDFSNLDHVLDCVQKDQLREEIIARAYEDVALNEALSYKTFVKEVLRNSLSEVKPRARTAWFYINVWREKFLWLKIRFEIFAREKLKKFLPVKWFAIIRKLKNRYLDA